MTEIGTRLTRIDPTSDLPATVTVVGVKGGRYVCQALETFSSPFDLTPNELRTIYGGDGEIVPDIDEVDAWRRFGADTLARAGEHASAEYVAASHALTPEQQFAHDARTADA